MNMLGEPHCLKYYDTYDSRRFSGRIKYYAPIFQSNVFPNITYVLYEAGAKFITESYNVCVLGWQPNTRGKL